MDFKNIKEYGDKKEILGEGTYGTVYECRRGEECVALKKFKTGFDDDGVKPDTLREISILNKYHHPNIVKLIDVANFNPSDNKTSIYAVLEIAEKSLDKYISDKTIEMNSTQLKSWMFQLSRGLNYLHTNGIWHRDIKPHNILIFKNKIVLADFGLARFGTISNSMYSTPVATLWWRAPELLLGARSYGPEIDVFSLGTVFIELFVKKYLFAGKDDNDTLMLQISVLGNMTDSEWPGISGMKNYNIVEKFASTRQMGKLTNILQPYRDILGEDGIQLLKMMTYPNPSKRISIYDVVNHTFFNSNLKTQVNNRLPFPKIPSYVCGNNLSADIIRIKHPSNFGDFNTAMLNILYNWLTEVSFEYHLNSETMFYARLLIDLYLQERVKYSDEELIPNTRKFLQAIGLVGLMISSKIFEIYPPDINDYIYISDNTYTIAQLKRTELSILKVTKFNIIFPTVSQFLSYYTQGLSQKSKKIAEKLALSYNMLGYEMIDSEKVAQASVFIAIQCSDEIIPECIKFKDMDYANKFINNLKKFKFKTPIALWKFILPVLNNWDTCMAQKQSLAIDISKRDGPLTPVPKSFEPKSNPTTNIKINRKLKVTRVEREDVTREDLGNIISAIILQQAVTATLSFTLKISKEKIQEFADYFHLIRTNTGEYMVSKNVPNRLEYNIGAFNLNTNITIKFNQVPINITELFDIFSNMLKYVSYDDGIIAGTIY